MIGFLKGRLMAVEHDVVLLDVGGVGYELSLSPASATELVAKIGDEIVLWVYTHVREDALQLFGFREPGEKRLFLALLKVNGVGPKSALTILSAGPSSTIMDLIESGDAKGLSSLPKVGKKTAEQIILTLQGKLVRAEVATTVSDPVQKQIQTALLNLGFKNQRVEEFVSKLPRDIDVEEGVRRGLSTLSNAFGN